jgi:hypothetical protein
VYLEFGHRFLGREQIDAVDIDFYLNDNDTTRPKEGPAP